MPRSTKKQSVADSVDGESAATGAPANAAAALEKSLRRQSQWFSRMFAMLPGSKEGSAVGADALTENAIAEMKKHWQREREKDAKLAQHGVPAKKPVKAGKARKPQLQRNAEAEKTPRTGSTKAAALGPAAKKPRTDAGGDGQVSDMKFSAFDFSSDKPVPSYLVKSAPKKGKGTSNTKALLAQAVREKKTKGVQAKWENAEKRMKGETVKDNTEILKKKLRSEKKQKEKSAKKWEERQKTLDDQQKAKQEKRRQNIREHNEMKKEKKLPKELRRPKQKERHLPHSLSKRKKILAAEKGKKRPGFEGKKKLLN